MEIWLISGFAVTVCALTCLGGHTLDANALVVERARFDPTSTTVHSHDQFSEIYPVYVEAEIRNKTARDITLPPSIKLRETTRFSPALKLTEFGLHGPVILRAGGTTRIRIEYDLYCRAGLDRKDCVKRALGDIDQIIVMDGRDNYEIRVPFADAVTSYLATP
jgi:hypothetical protein